MNLDAHLTLPVALGAGLVMRWATAADAPAVAAFNLAMHSDNPAEPEEGLSIWTYDLFSGQHPTTGPGDFTVVVDDQGQIVSSLCLISQTWAIDGLAFGVGRPELVATLPEYRRRGLVRRQMAVVHSLSAARGELVQVITGIPWYYRQFGYEMTVDLGGSRDFVWSRPGNSPPVTEEPYRFRPAAADDIPHLAALYAIHCQASLVYRVRSQAEWLYELTLQDPAAVNGQRFGVVETPAGEIAGYVEYAIWSRSVNIREVAARPGHSLRALCLFLTRHFKPTPLPSGAPADHLTFRLGTAHPAYTALGRQLSKPDNAYAYFLRVPDLPAFLRHLAPVLERRLAGSVMAGHTGTLRLNFYQQQLTLRFDTGRLAEIGTFQPAYAHDGDACLPDLTFLHLLFGHRSLEQLRQLRVDCFAANAEAAVLLDVLFPTRPSYPVTLS